MTNTSAKSHTVAAVIALLVCLAVLAVIKTYFLPALGLPPTKDGIWVLEVAAVLMVFGAIILDELLKLFRALQPGPRGYSKPTYLFVALAVVITLSGSALFLWVTLHLVQ